MIKNNMKNSPRANGGILDGLRRGWASLNCVALHHAANISLQNEVKRAIDKGRNWLEQHQDALGFWSTADHPAITALAVAALRAPPGDREQRTEAAIVTRG